MDTAVAIADAPAENVLENALVMEGAADVATEIERNRKATRFAVADDVTVADIDRNKLAALVNDGTVEDTAERVMDMALEIAATPVDEAAITRE
jgi:transglutaminase/protease-like cytokinesis protein 3